MTSWTAECQASLSFTICQSLLKLLSIESMMPSNHLILYSPFLLLPAIFLSTRVFSNNLALYTRWPKYWSLGFSISNSNERFLLEFPLNSPPISLFQLGLTGLISLQSKGLSRIFSNTTVRKCQFFSAQPLLWSNSTLVHGY